MVKQLFEGKDHAAIYLQYRVAPHTLISKIMSYMEKKVWELLFYSIQTTKEFKLAVDVGCGPRQGTVHLAPYFTNVVGTDVSKAMVERALVKGNPPNISYRQCPAEELPFTPGEVELLTAMTTRCLLEGMANLQQVAHLCAILTTICSVHKEQRDNHSDDPK
ncbi:uncharacterized protein V3H82_023737 [Fundulus diaphanus]